MLTTLYRKFVPEKVRNTIYKAFLKDFLQFYRPYRSWLYTTIRGRASKEEQEAFKILWKYGISAYPYSWRHEYEKVTYPVHIDENNSLPYVIHHNKKLYFNTQRCTPFIGTCIRIIRFHCSIPYKKCRTRNQRHIERLTFPGRNYAWIPIP